MLVASPTGMDTRTNSRTDQQESDCERRKISGNTIKHPFHQPTSCSAAATAARMAAVVIFRRVM